MSLQVRDYDGLQRLTTDGICWRNLIIFKQVVSNLQVLGNEGGIIINLNGVITKTGGGLRQCLSNNTAAM